MNLLLPAVIPPLLLVYYTYKLDKIEKEPPKLLFALFVLGAAITIFAGVFESILLGALERFLDPSGMPYLLISNFMIIALIEEGLKYRLLKGLTWKNPNFDYHFDAIVYAVTVSLGFAAFENVLYVFQGGIGVAVLRALTAIPGHCIFAIFMGSYYGTMKYHFTNGNTEGYKTSRILTLLVPVLIHGFYDFSASLRSDASAIVFLVFIVVMDILAFRRIRKLSREDRKLKDDTDNDHITIEDQFNSDTFQQ